MPELPEVETISRELARKIKNKRISEVIVKKSRVLKKLKPAEFRKKLKCVEVQKVFRKGKAVVMALSSGEYLIFQLGMTGQLIYPAKGNAARISLRFNDKKTLAFNDTRMFGAVNLMGDYKDLPYIKSLGPEPFDLKPAEFYRMLQKKTTKIKNLLLDQKFIAGVGNIYACEALFRAGIHPSRCARDLSKKEAKALLEELIKTLKEAILHGGSSVDDYVKADGSTGNFSNFHRVYNREGELCFICEGEIKREVLGGRGTYICEECQPACDE